MEISELESEPEILTTEPLRDHAAPRSILLGSPSAEFPDPKGTTLIKWDTFIFPNGVYLLILANIRFLYTKITITPFYKMAV